MNILFLITSLFLFSTKNIDAQPLTINMEDASGCIGETVCIDMIVENFIQIEGFEMQLVFDPTVMTYSSFTPVLDNFNVNTTKINQTGWSFVLWTNLAAEDTTLPDGTSIGTFCYEITAEAGDSTTIELLPENNYFNAIGDEGNIIFNGSTITTTSCDEYDILTKWCSPSTINSTDGTLNVSACCDSGPYSFTIAPSLGGGGGAIFNDNEYFTFTNVPADTYTITMTSATGTVKMKEITIGASPSIGYLDVFATNPSCWNKSNGKIIIDGLFDGFPPYKITWSTGEFKQNVQILSGDTIQDLPSGTYGLTITDQVGCELILQETLYTDTIFATAMVIDSASCLGINDGMIKVTGERGKKSAGIGYYFNGVIAAVPVEMKTFFVGPGWHEYFVSGDPVNCYSEIDSIYVPVKNELHVTLDNTVPFVDYNPDLDCFSDLTSIALKLNTGENLSPFSTIKDEDGQSITTGTLGGSTLVGEDIKPGTYHINLIASNPSCHADTIITITSPDSLYIDSEVSPPTCTSTNGTITLEGQGGVPSYDFEWNDGPNSKDRIDLGSGIYVVTMTDMNGCKDSLTVDFNAGVALEIKIDTIQLISCESPNSGSITATVLTAGNDFSYSWTNPSGTFSANTATISNLGADTYYLEVFDNTNGCSANDSITLLAIGDIEIDSILTIPTCHNTLDGSIAISITGGSGGYEIDWEGYPAYKDLNVLAGIGQGSYTVTVTDDINCTQVSTFILNAPQPLTVSVDNIQDAICFGTNTGSAVAKGANGSNGINYDYVWSSSPLDGNTDVPFEQATHLGVGTQWVYAFDGFCSSDTFFFEVMEPEEFVFESINLTTPSCGGSCDGEINVVASGGIPNYSYQWENGSIDKEQVALCAGEYEVTITDFNGCELDTTILLTEPDTFLLSIDTIRTMNISCNDVGGVIAVSTTGGNQGNILYTWPNGESTTDIATGLSAGTYEITATDSRGCTDTTATTLTSAEPIVGNIAFIEPIPCFGGVTCLSVENVSGGVGNFSFAVNTSINFPIDSCITITSGMNYVNIFDGAGCFISDSIFVPQPDQTILNITPEDPVFDLGQDPMVLDLNITNANAPTDSIIWTPFDELDCVDNDCLQIMISPVTHTTYFVTRIDDNGCESKTQVRVTVSSNRNVYFPNTFRPNSDQSDNSLFSFDLGPGVEQLEYLQIFDRWGNEIFHRKNILPGDEATAAWDGTYKGQELTPDVFVYIASVSFIDGKTIPYKGSITILK